MSANGGFGPVSTGAGGALATLFAFLAAAYPSSVMAATTGADIMSAAASRSAGFRMVITKRFSTDLANNQRTHFFSSSALLCSLIRRFIDFTSGIYLQPEIRKTARVGQQ